MTMRGPKISEGATGHVILTRKQLMVWLHISHGTLNKMMKVEGLPFFRIGKKVLFFMDDVIPYLKSKKRPGS